MNTISCKVPLIRPMIHQGSLDGLEGPATRTGVNEYGEAMQQGQITSYYNTKFTMTPGRKGQIQYDGSIEIFDTEFNRKKIAAMVRHGDLIVLDKDLQDEILEQFGGQSKVSDGEFTEVKPVISTIGKAVAKKNQNQSRIEDKQFRKESAKQEAPKVSSHPGDKFGEDDQPDAE